MRALLDVNVLIASDSDPDVVPLLRYITLLMTLP